jgi:cytochrome c oxidase cbb3-type subunit 2
MFESKSGVLLIAGMGFFLLAFLSNGAVPWLMYADKKEQTVEEMIAAQVERTAQAQPPQSITNVVTHFQQLHEFYHDSFVKVYGDPVAEKWGSEKWQEQCARAVRTGHKVYVAEACWHCHSQFIRPVSREAERWGPVSQNWEYTNELQKPVLFGTRRVGPDLSREGGRHSNDWHTAHFWRPRDTSPVSVMPEYPWFFDGDQGRPNERGLGLITYMQFLGSWLPSYPHYTQNTPTER